jgi:glyoxylase-like metal-dependent hydrolase (beta-lactamase superfamily II)
MNLSRRSLFKFGAFGAAALSTPSLITTRAFAEVPMSTVTQAGFNRLKLGSFEVTVLQDGARAVENPQSIFGTNKTKEEVEGLLTENFLPIDKMQFTFAPVLVNTGTDLILFDTGNGAGGREGGAGRMLENLKASGYTPEQVTLVVISHMHGDHIGGITEGGAPTFPNARYAFGQAEFDFWKDEKLIGSPAEGGHKGVVANIVPLAEKATFYGDGASIASGITAIAAAGHTPGHTVFNIESGGRNLMLTADTANHFVLSLRQPDWEVRFDADKAAAAATRRKVFERIAADRIPFIGYHMPYPSVGYVEKAGEGFRFVPETYQLDI